MFSVTLQSEGKEPKKFNFDKDEITIGRLSSSDITLNATNVSKQHSRIVFREQRYFIIDRKSTNGTFVNGNRVTVPISLKDGDKIYVGDFILVFEKTEGAAEAVAPADTAEKEVPVPPPLPPVENAAEPTPGESVDTDVPQLEEHDHEVENVEMDIYAEIKLELYIRAMDFDEFAEPEEFIRYRFDDEEFSESLYNKLEIILDEMELEEITDDLKESILTDTVQELVGYGPLEEMLFDDEIDEIFINGPEIIITRKGPIKEVSTGFFCCEESLFNIMVRILQPFNVLLEEDSALIDAVLPELRITGVMHPFTTGGTVLRLIKTPLKHLALDNLVESNVLTQEMADYIALALDDDKTIAVVSADEYDRSDLLEAFGSAIPLSNRIASYNTGTSVILPHPDMISLETAIGDVIESGALADADDLFTHLNKMAVDRLLVSNIDDTTALPLMMVLNNGLHSSIFSISGRNCKDAKSRLARMLRLAGHMDKDLADELINANIDIMVCIERYKSGEARLSCILEYNRDLDETIKRFTFKVESDTEEELVGEFVQDDSL